MFEYVTILQKKIENLIRKIDSQKKERTDKIKVK